jgi:hypothetical protein
VCTLDEDGVCSKRHVRGNGAVFDWEGPRRLVRPRGGVYPRIRVECRRMGGNGR